VLDFRGEARVWMPANAPYKYVFAPPSDTDPPGAPIWTVDQVQNAQLLTLYGGVDTGSANAYVLTFDASFPAYEDGIVLYWIPSHTNTGPATVAVNGLASVPLEISIGGFLTPLRAGQVVSGQIVSMIYIGGKFVLLSGTIFSGSFTATLTGMDSTVTGDAGYSVNNGTVTVFIGSVDVAGTSNATTMTMTGLPAQISSPENPIYIVCDKLIDNGVQCYGTAIISGSTITFRMATVSGSRIVDGNFTNTGTKGIAAGWGLMYQL